MSIKLDLRENAMFKDIFAEMDAKQESTQKLLLEERQKVKTYQEQVKAYRQQIQLLRAQAKENAKEIDRSILVLYQLMHFSVRTIATVVNKDSTYIEALIAQSVEATCYTEKRKAILNLHHNLELEPSLIASVYEMNEKEVQTMLDRGEFQINTASVQTQLMKTASQIECTNSFPSSTSSPE